MINVRYHIITLVAVFLALAIGLVAGSTVIQQSLVDQLEGNLDNLDSRLQEVEKRNGQLDDQLGQLRERDKALGDQGPAQLLANRLEGTTVLMIGVDGIDEGSMQSLRQTLGTSGAQLTGTLWLRDRLALTDDQSIEDLATVLGVATRNPAALQAELAQRVGDLLAVAAAPTEVIEAATTTTTRPVVSGDTAAGAATRLMTLLADLQQARFVDLDGGLSDTRPAQLVGVRLVVAGGTGAKVGEDAVVMPLLERLSQDVDPVAVAVEAAPADPEAPRSVFVSAVRSDRRLRDRLSTVDDAETFVGWAATVLALDDLGRGRVGHYGVSSGAERLLPEPAPS
jgi:hypothetical protein